MTNLNENFRPDIAGLRALAVGLVLFSHFGIPGFGFGFIGVDIFFVISGFLITRILYKDYLSSSQGADNKATLSLGTFYLRRVRRLLPAALVVIVFVNIASLFLFNPQSRTELFVNSKWALLFLANVSFLRSEADYFQNNSEPSMLQHFWSLSVEEQFYFIWPLLFLIAASLHKLKFRGKYFRFNKRILVLIGTVSILSYIFLHFGFRLAPTQSYFSIFTRAWELGIGSFLGILAYHKKKDAFYSRVERYSLLVIALALGAALINRDNWAIWMPLPVLATGVILYTGQNQQIPNRTYGKPLKVFSRFILYIGTISYSLYLVHWPLFIIANHYELANGILGKLLLIPISIFAAHLLWKFIEIPFQNIKLPKKSNFEDFAFNFVKLRKMWIGSIALVVVGSLYLVTYPSATERLIYSDSKLAGVADDPTIRRYANFQDNIVNPIDSNNGNAPLLNESGTSTSVSKSLPELLAENKQSLKAGLNQTKLTFSGQNVFSRNSEDKSPFELSECAKIDSEVPPDCSNRPAGQTSKMVALIGDSKMGQFAQPLIDYFSARGWKVRPFVLNGCPIYAPRDNELRNCTKRSEWVKREISLGSFDLVVIASYPLSPDKISTVNSYIRIIAKYAKNTILLTQFPTVGNPTNCINADFSYDKKCSNIHATETFSYNAFKTNLFRLRNTKISIIDTTLWTCIELSCPIVVGDTFMTREGNHLSYTFIKKITPIIQASLDELVTS